MSDSADRKARAARAVLDSAAERLHERTEHLDLEEACARLGISADRVRARAEEMRRG